MILKIGIAAAVVVVILIVGWAAVKSLGADEPKRKKAETDKDTDRRYLRGLAGDPDPRKGAR